MSHPPGRSASDAPARVVYCNCTYARIIPEEVKREVLGRLCDSDVAFMAVPDLCEMSAHKDPALKAMAADPDTRIVACYPRAVKWLFDAAGAPLADAQKTVVNMRVTGAEEIVAAVCSTPPVPATEESG
ncbi:MAG: hypothetical protein ACE5IK_09120 [Acidobacteriota bacterium]